MRSLLFAIAGLTFGVCVGYYFLFYTPQTLVQLKSHFFPPSPLSSPDQKHIIGFLPYWLVSSAQIDYSEYISTLTYFGLTIDSDGKIQYFANEQEEEPGYHMLKSKRLKTMLENAKEKGQITSLLVFSGDSDAIEQLMQNPTPHAQNLVKDIAPLMKKYGFTDLNLDIESTRGASEEARQNFTTFVREVKKEMTQKKLGTVTVEITGNDLIRENLIDPREIAKIADHVVIMAYDFHYATSQVTGAVAPLGGAESEAEFDTKIVLQQAYKVIPKEKIILGVPSYGYSWETLHATPKSATLPGSGLTMSHAKTEAFLRSCSTCSAVLDTKAQEPYIIYKNQETTTYQQIFYPDKNAMQKKVDITMENNLAGLAIWALGYENIDLYTPLMQYKKDLVDISRL